MNDGNFPQFVSNSMLRGGDGDKIFHSGERSSVLKTGRGLQVLLRRLSLNTSGWSFFESPLIVLPEVTYFHTRIRTHTVLSIPGGDTVHKNASSTVYRCIGPRSGFIQIQVRIPDRIRDEEGQTRQKE
jgi:hypothetical protein